MGLGVGARSLLILASAPFALNAQRMAFRGHEGSEGEASERGGEAPEEDFKHMLKDEFKTLSKQSLKLQCQQLENAQSRGQEKWLAEQPFYKGLSKMCEAMKEHNPKKVHEAVHEERKEIVHAAKAMKEDFQTNTAGKSVALGCTALLKAKNDGKMEWFESQGWYKKAMTMCTSLAGQSPMDLEKRMQASQGKLAGKFGSLQGKAPLQLLKDTCTKIEKIPQDSPVREKKWFPNAESMCATVQSSTQDELRELIKRQQHHAESSSGQVIKQTCQKLKKDQQTGGLKHFEDEAWYPAMSKMCAKLGPKKVSKKGLKQRCDWLQKIKKSKKESVFNQQAWYKHLESTCTWLQHKKEQRDDSEEHILV